MPDRYLLEDGSYEAEVLALGPIAYWRLGEPSGTVAFDASGNGRHGTYVNTPTLGAAGLLTGDADTAADFLYSSNEHVAVAALPAGPTAHFSATAVVRHDEAWRGDSLSDYATIVAWHTSDWTGHHWFFVWDGYLCYQYTDGTANRNVFAPAATLTIGQVHHVAVVHDFAAETVKFYTDGALTSTHDVSANGAVVPVAAGKRISVGNLIEDLTHHWSGVLDEVAIYGSALTLADVETLYEFGTGTAPPNTTDGYLLEDGSGVYLLEGAGDDAVDVVETGSGSDTAELDATPPPADDSGVGTDDATVTVPADAVETGTGADVVTAVTEPAPGTDTGAGSEAAALDATPPPAVDSGTGTDSGVLSYAEQFLAEQGSASSELATLELLAADVGIGSDMVSLAILSEPHWSILIEDETGAMVERRSWVRPFRSLRVENRSIGGAGTATIPIYDPLRELDLTTERRVRIVHREVEAFEGFVRRRRRADRGWSDGPVLYVLECQDFTTLPYDDVIETAYRSVAESDKARISWLVSTHGTKGITAGAEVQNLLASMPPGEDGRPEQDFSAKSLGEAVDQVLAISGGLKYVDSDKRLHTFKTEATAAPFNLSDQPNGTTTRGYGNLVLTDDSIDLRHRVLVAGTGVKIWRELGVLPAADKIREAVIRDPDITTVAQAQAVGDAFLDQHGASNLAGSLTCYQAGLRAGQNVQVSHLGLGLVDQSFPIVSVSMQPVAPEVASFDVQLGDGELDLGDVVSATRRTVALLDDQAAETAAMLTDLSVAGANMLANSSFESADTTGYSIGAGWSFGYDPVSPQEAAFGSKTARLVRAGTAAGPLLTPFIPVARSDDWWMSYYSFLRSISSGTLRARVNEYNAAQTLLISTDLTVPTVVETEPMRYALHFGPNDQLGRRTFHADTRFVRLEFDDATTGTFTWDIDGVQVERGKLLTAYAPAPQELVDGQIVAAHIANLAITNTKIADDAISTPKLQANAVEAAKIAAGAVEANKIAANAVVAGKIAAGVVSTTELAASAVTADKVAAGAITAEKLTVTGRGPYLTNAGFETGTLTGWSVANGVGGAGSVYVEDPASNDAEGRYRAVLHRPSAGTNPEISQLVNARAGEYMTVSMLADGPSTSALVIYVEWRNAGGVISYSGDTPVIQVGALGRVRSTLGPAPASTTTARIIVVNNATGYLKVDDVLVERGAVVMDASGIRVVHGAIVVESPLGTVIIDGSSNMFKIVATGTIAESAFTGPTTQTTSVDIATGLSYRPSFLAYVLLPNPWGDGYDRAVLIPDFEIEGNYDPIRLIRRRVAGTAVVPTNVTRLSIHHTWAKGTSSGTASYRYHVLKEASI